MNQEQLKALLLRDKAFLKELFDGSNVVKNKALLYSTDTSQLNTLIKYLHFVANGEIHISRINFDAISKAKKLKFIQNHVESKSNCLKLVNSDRKTKLQFLVKLANLYYALLWSLFNLP